MRIAVVTIMFAFMCCGAQLNGEEPKSKKMHELKKASIEGVRKAHQAGNVLLAGQPSEEAFEKLSQQGYKTIITLRHTDEEHFDEAKVCEMLGLKFVRLQITSPDDMNVQMMDRCCRLLDEAKPGAGVVLHCAGANRVGAVWLAHRVLRDGMTLDKASEEAAKVGLHTKELQKKAMEYVESKQ